MNEVLHLEEKRMLEQNLFRLRSTLLFPPSLTLFIFLLTHRSAMLFVSIRVLEIMGFHTEEVFF